MVALSYYVWIVTLFANTILTLLLIFNGWYVRYGWLTLTCLLAVVADGVMWWCHTYTHSLYEPLRLFIFYFLFYALDALVIWEAWRWNNRRVRLPMEILLGVSLVVIATKKADLLWVTYFLECGLRWFNMLITLYFISQFRREAKYVL